MFLPRCLDLIRKISDVDDLAISGVDLSCLSSNFGGLIFEICDGLTLNDLTHFLEGST